MKRSKKEMKDDEKGVECCSEPYPYGLEINFDDDSLTKLKQGLMPVGTEIMFTAKSVVKSVSQSEHEGNDMNRNMSLQITDMEITLEEKDDSAVAERFYGG
jgi:hypothetical protein